MTAPAIKGTLGRPARELVGGPGSDAPIGTFVRTTGDEMTGTLQLRPATGDAVEVFDAGNVMRYYVTKDGEVHAVQFFGSGINLSDVVQLASVGAANGVAALDSTGKVPTSQLPAFSLVDVFTVASQAAMLALSTANPGDIAVRTDLSETFVLTALPPSTLANWQQLLSPTGVTSFNGRNGTVLPQALDYSWGDLDNLPTTLADAGLLADFLTEGGAHFMPIIDYTLVDTATIRDPGAIGRPDSDIFSYSGLYTQWSGAWGTKSTQGLFESSGTATGALVTDTSLIDHEVTAHIENYQCAGVIVRGNAANDYLAVVVGLPVSGSFRRLQIIAYRSSTTPVVLNGVGLANLGSVTTISGGRCTLRVQMIGHIMNIYLNGWAFTQFALTGADIARYASGTIVGMYTRNDSDANFGYISAGAASGSFDISGISGDNPVRTDVRYMARGFRPRWQELYGGMPQTVRAPLDGGLTKLNIATSQPLDSVTHAVSSSGVGIEGDIRWDSNYLYICVAPNSWKRVALTTF